MSEEYNRNWQDKTKSVAIGIRRRILELVIERNGGYLSQACSAAEILATLYTYVLNIGSSTAPLVPIPFISVPNANNPHNLITGSKYNGPKAAHFDRFILSPAHYAMVVYAVLTETGRMSPEGFLLLNTEGSSIEMIGAEYSPGLELTTGSLGQALSQAGGIALARKLRGETGRVWVFMSDGELEEGQTWEAVQSLVHLKLGNVAVYVDINGQQVDGLTKNIMNMEPIYNKFESFGAKVVRVNGHDIEALAAPAKIPICDKPLFILAYTNPCQGIPLLDELEPSARHLIRFTNEEERNRYIDYLKMMQKEEELT